ncbi:hypothetical protein ABW19_dt0203393 [Dactylella cylindrospora]|nr:hypothetical protein ABW19_dt0203393 [Dactylella cylindrospora]
MISFIFSTVIVTAGKKSSGKDLYIVSFEYDIPIMPPSTGTLAKRQDEASTEAPKTTIRSTNVATVPATVTVAPSATEAPEPSTTEDAETTTMMAPSPTVNLVLQEKFKQAVQSLIAEDNNNATIQFSHARVSYSGICVEVESMEGIKGSQWICGNMNTTEVLGATAGGDPFDLIGVAMYFKDKIAFSLPWWVATVSLGIAMACQMVLMIPFLPIPPVVQKVAAVLSILGCMALLGGLVLQHVASHTVASLSNKLTMGTVNAHVGRMNQALGWSGFALSLLASIAVGVVVAAELALEKSEQMFDKGVDKAVDMAASRSPFSSAEQHRNFSGSSNDSGLGRSLRANAPDVLSGLAKAKTRGEALSAVASGFRSEKTPRPPHNMV